MIQDTSLQAYQDHQEVFEESRIKVLRALKEIQPANNKMIQRSTGMAINSVSGRMNDLANKYKMVTFSHRAPCPHTNVKTLFWKLTRRGEDNLNKQGGQ